MSAEDQNPDDMKIGAWLDGELDKDGATGMTISSATNDAMAARALRLKHIDGLVRAAVPDEDAVPEALLERLGLSERKASSNILNFASARRARDARRGADQLGEGGWFRNQAPWRMAAQVALAVGVGLGGFLLLGNPGPTGGGEAYRTLSDKVSPADVGTLPSNALVIFADGTDAKVARKIVESAGGRLIGTPNDTGAWKMAIAPARVMLRLSLCGKTSASHLQNRWMEGRGDPATRLARRLHGACVFVHGGGNAGIGG